MRRKGLGKNLGKGYFNIIPNYDSYIHSLSARGVKLQPRYDARKSFYGKAEVVEEDGDKTLLSYGTKVAEIVDGKPKVYGYYSQTTMRHIREFLKQNGFFADNKDQILEDYGIKDLDAKIKKSIGSAYETTKKGLGKGIRWTEREIKGEN